MTKPIEQIMVDTLIRIADALEELVEVQKTEPLSKIIHPSSMKERFDNYPDLPDLEETNATK